MERLNFIKIGLLAFYGALLNPKSLGSKQVQSEIIKNFNSFSCHRVLSAEINYRDGRTQEIITKEQWQDQQTIRYLIGGDENNKII